MDKLQILKDYKCPKCGHKVFKSEIDGYFAQCFECDEDFYKFELSKVEHGV